MNSKVLIFCDKLYEVSEYRLTFRDFGRILVIDDIRSCCISKYKLNSRVTSNNLFAYPVPVIREYVSKNLTCRDLVQIYHNGIIVIRPGFDTKMKKPIAFNIKPVKVHEVVKINKTIAFSINV